VKIYGKDPPERLSGVGFEAKGARSGFYGHFLREIFACNHIALRKAVRRAIFHATNRGSNVGDHIAKNAVRHW
jgi:hypothetical protein